MVFCRHCSFIYATSTYYAHRNSTGEATPLSNCESPLCCALDSGTSLTNKLQGLAKDGGFLEVTVAVDLFALLDRNLEVVAGGCGFVRLKGVGVELSKGLC